MAQPPKHPASERHFLASARHQAAAHHHSRPPIFTIWDSTKEHATAAHEHSELAHKHTATATDILRR